MVEGMLISADMPGNATAAAATGLRGILASFTAARGMLMPLMLISRGGGAEHSCSPQFTASSSRVATRRERYRSGLPLSTQARTRLVVPSGSGRSTSMTTRLWSKVMGTVTDFDSGRGADDFCASAGVQRISKTKQILSCILEL